MPSYSNFAAVITTQDAWLLAGVLFLCLLISPLPGSWRRRRHDRSSWPIGLYRSRPLLSAWELRTLAMMAAELPAGYHACPQVRVADMLDVLGSGSAHLSALNKVASKSVDFAIIDGRGEVALVVELDDRSHLRADRRERDAFVEAVFRRCDVAVLRVRPGQRLDVRAALEQNPISLVRNRLR